MEDPSPKYIGTLEITSGCHRHGLLPLLSTGGRRAHCSVVLFRGTVQQRVACVSGCPMFRFESRAKQKKHKEPKHGNSFGFAVFPGGATTCVSQITNSHWGIPFSTAYSPGRLGFGGYLVSAAQTNFVHASATDIQTGSHGAVSTMGPSTRLVDLHGARGVFSSFDRCRPTPPLAQRFLAVADLSVGRPPRWHGGVVRLPRSARCPSYTST